MADFYQNPFEALISLTLEQLFFHLIKPTYSCTGELNLFSLFKRVIAGHLAATAGGLGAKRLAECIVHLPLVSVLKIHTWVPVLSLLA